MQRLLFLGIAIIICFSLVIEPCYAAEHGPKLVCEKPVYSFGEMLDIETVKHTFILHNKGNAPLAISNLYPCCGCITTDLSADMIAPNSKATLDVELNPPQTAVKVYDRWKITIESKDPRYPKLILPKLELYLEGTVITEIGAYPHWVYFKNITPGTTAKKEVDITAGSDKDFKITKLEYDTSRYDVKQETLADGRSYRIHIKLKPMQFPRRLEDNLYVFTDNLNYSKIDIPIVVKIGILTVAPEEMVLVKKKTFPVITRYITIRSDEDKPFKIESIETPLPSIQTKLSPLGKDGYRIQLSNIKPTRELDGKRLRITTNLDKMKEILIPFRIISESSKSK